MISFFEVAGVWLVLYQKDLESLVLILRLVRGGFHRDLVYVIAYHCMRVLHTLKQTNT